MCYDWLKLIVDIGYSGHFATLSCIHTLLGVQCFFVDDDDNGNENDAFLKFLLMGLKLKRKRRRAENKIKISSILVLRKMSDAKFGT